MKKEYFRPLRLHPSQDSFHTLASSSRTDVVVAVDQRETQRRGIKPVLLVLVAVLPERGGVHEMKGGGRGGLSGTHPHHRRFMDIF